MSKLKASVILPHFDRLDVLTETMTSLANQTIRTTEFEVIVVDDSLNPDIARIIDSLDLPYYHQIHYQDHKGAAVGRNRGASSARGDLLIFLDCDMVAPPNLLSEHLKSHQTFSRALVSGPRKNWNESSDKPFTVTSKTFSRYEDPKSIKPVFTFQEAFTCNLSLRSDHWSSIGGFDEEFPPGTGFEDTDFAYRATQLGFEIVLNHNAIAYHNHPQTTVQRYQQERNYQRSAPLLLRKHPELRGRIEHLADKEPINLSNDKPNLIARKLGRRFLALKPNLWAMEQAYSLLEGREVPPRLLRFLYFKVLGSYQLIGFREGIELYGW